MTSRAAISRRQPTGTDLLAVPTRLANLVERQSGVLTRTQLHECGMTTAAVRAALAARRWRAFGRNVIVVHNGQITETQRQWIAVLLPQKLAALAGPTAAAEGGLLGFESEQIHVVVPHDTHVRVPSWIKLHESRRFGPADALLTAGLPRTRPPRSLIDTATWSRRPRRACAVLCAGVQQRLVTPEALDTELSRAGAVRHVAIMRAILGDIAGGGHTLAEIDLGPLARRAGLPLPRRQALRREPNGKIRYVDAEFDLPDGTLLAVEIDGAMHLQPFSWWDDMDRQNEIVIGRQPVLRFPSLTVRLNEERVVDQLRRMRLAYTRP